MVISQTTNDGKKPEPGLDEKMQKHLDLEIREMISALMNRLANLQHLQKAAAGYSSHHLHLQEEDADDDHGMRIITLAGNNVGATMSGEMDDQKKTTNTAGEHDDQALSTYVNSNFQAINNTIMMGGSYSTNDPGVHMDISDYMEEHQKTPISDSKLHGNKGKKSHKESSKSDQDHFE